MVCLKQQFLKNCQKLTGESILLRCCYKKIISSSAGAFTSFTNLTEKLQMFFILELHTSQSLKECSLKGTVPTAHSSTFSTAAVQQSNFILHELLVWMMNARYVSFHSKIILLFHPRSRWRVTCC